MTGEGAEDQKPERRWIRAALLFLFALWVPVLPSMSLVTIPFVFLALLLPRRGSAVLALAALGLVVTLTLAPPSGGLWYVERGWAVLLGGWFVALTLRWPSSPFISRALGAVAGASAVTLALLSSRPGGARELDGLVKERLVELAALARETTARLATDDQVQTAMMTAVEAMTQIREQFYPGLLLIASVCALGVAWWAYVRLGQGSDRGLGPLRDFRFNDQLVWVTVVAVAAVLWGSSGGVTGFGANALLVMAALYAVRGAAVVVFVTGGVSLTGGVLVTLGMLFVAPYLVSLAVFIGLGDTWLGLRERARSALGGGSDA